MPFSALPISRRNSPAIPHAALPKGHRDSDDAPRDTGIGLWCVQAGRPKAGGVSQRALKATFCGTNGRAYRASSVRATRGLPVSLVTRIPVAETVDNARKQQGLAETSPTRQLSPAGYQRRHGVKDDVETGETLGARRRNLVEEMPAITVSGKRGHRCQGDGSGRSTVDGRAAKRARREGPGPVSTPLTKARLNSCRS